MIKKIPYFDLHLDLEVLLNDNLRKFLGFKNKQLTKIDRQRHFDLIQARRVNLQYAVVQLQSLKIEHNQIKPILNFNEFYERALNFLNKIKKLKFIKIVKTFKDFNQTGFKIILGIEGIYFLKKENEIEKLYNLGLRVFDLSWNFDNNLVGGLNSPFKGLTLFGKKIVQKIIKMNCLIDLAHMSDQAKKEVISKYPQWSLFSHNNTFLTPHLQNLNFEILKEVKKHQILVGLTFLPKALNQNNFLGWKEHYDFLRRWAPLSLALGTDFLGYSFSESATDCFNYLELDKQFTRYRINRRLLFDNAYKKFYNISKLWKI